ncbi:ABC transporter permease [Candidatus Thorarchaeota archaeon]|nr:MAG: ABC transporter permease [Candidatus Thorarchaeota archaeon]
MVRMTSELESSPQEPVHHELQTYVKEILLRIVVPIVVLLVLWQVIAVLSRTSLLDVMNAFIRLTTVGDSEGYLLSDHLLMSLTRVLLGFVFAAVTAIPLGVAVGRYRLANWALGPVIEAMRPIPPIAWIPLSILMFRNNLLGAQVFIIWIGAFFPILIDTTTGVKRTEPVHIDVAKTFGANEGQILSSIVVPSASPEIFSGLRIGFGIGWMCLVAAEMIGGGLGLGYLVIIMQQAGRTGAVIASMLVIGAIGIVISYAFLILERNALKWRQAVSV